MFPASDQNVQSHRAGWLNRIMATQQKSLSAPQHGVRTFTPLRPNAGVVGRVPTPGSRPSTQQGSRPAPVPVPAQPNSARGPAPARLPALPSPTPKQPGQMNTAALGSAATATSADRSPTSIQSPLYASDHDPFLEHEQLVLDEVNALRANPAAYAAIAESELRVLDPYVVSVPESSAEVAAATSRRLSRVDSTAAARRPSESNPQAAAAMDESAVSGASVTAAARGQTPALMEPMNLSELTAFADQQEKRLTAARDHLESLDADEEKKIAAMREQWAAEDAERAKKKGKAPAPKKGAKDDKLAAPTALSPEEMEAEREATIAEFRESSAADRVETRSLIDALTNSCKRAQQGVKVLRTLSAKLAATPPLQQLDRNRGLCLAARDMADNEPKGSVNVDSLTYTNRFGGGEGPYGQGTALGRLTPQATVLDLLLCLHDPGKRRARHALLSPQMRLIGVGWRRNPETIAATSVIVACNFSEFAAIAARSHLPLQDVRRVLPFATKLSSNTSVRLDVPKGSGIEVVEPASHPVALQKSKYLRAVVKCPSDYTICAALVAEGDVEPAQPSSMSNETFVQRSPNGDAVEIHVSFPGDGRYNVVVYGQVPSPTTKPSADFSSTFNATLFSSTNAVSSSGLTPRTRFNATLGAGSVAVGRNASDDEDVTRGIFRRLGVINVDVADSDPLVNAPRFAVAAADFHERRCRINSSLSGVLRPDVACTFNLSVPFTNYKGSEVQRVKVGLAAATRRVEGSQQRTEELEAELEGAIAAIAQAEETAATSTPTIQQEIATLQKDLAKKKGKDAEKWRGAIADAEERLAALDVALRAAKEAKAAAEEKLSTHRRSARQSSAMRRRYLADEEQLARLTDRSKPLDVEISVEDRRAAVPSTNDEGTEYEVMVRTPKSGTIALLISGVTVVEYVVEPEAADWPEAAFTFAA